MEAIKKAVEVGLGAAFVSRAAVQKELQLGLLSAVKLEACLVVHCVLICSKLWEVCTRLPGMPALEHLLSPWARSPGIASLQGVTLNRQLVCVTDPVRYCSHAVRAFIRELFGFTLETSATGCFLPPPQRVSQRSPSSRACCGGVLGSMYVQQQRAAQSGPDLRPCTRHSEDTVWCAQEPDTDGTRYPELRGRGPKVADLSTLTWGHDSTDQGEPCSLGS